MRAAYHLTAGRDRHHVGNPDRPGWSICGVKTEHPAMVKPKGPRCVWCAKITVPRRPRYLGRRTTDLATRFWAKVEHEPMSGCLLWTASLDAKGYTLAVGCPTLDTAPRPELVVAPIRHCVTGPALGCLHEDRPHRILLDPRTPRGLVRKVVVHELTHRALLICGGRWMDERLTHPACWDKMFGGDDA